MNWKISSIAQRYDIVEARPSVYVIWYESVKARPGYVSTLTNLAIIELEDLVFRES